MYKVLDIFKNMFLDLFLMGKGFTYGFLMAVLFIVICSALIYGIFMFTKNDWGIHEQIGLCFIGIGR